MIKAKDLVLRYGTHTALAIARLEVAQKQHGLVVGPSGCGKSTLLHLIAAMLMPSSGSLIVDQIELSTLSAAERDRFRRARIGFIFQRLHLIDALAVIDNLLLAQKLAGHRPCRTAALNLLNRLGIAQLAQRLPIDLSLGESQRVAIARALIIRPKIILADEPTAALDDQNTSAFIQLLDQMAADCTLLIATHDGRVKQHIKIVLDLHPGGANL